MATENEKCLPKDGDIFKSPHVKAGDGLICVKGIICTLRVDLYVLLWIFILP